MWRAFKQKAQKRVVVTGMGAVTPLGIDLETIFQGLLNRKCGVVKVTKEILPEIDEMPAKIGGTIKEDLSPWTSKMPSHKTLQNSFAFVAALKAFEDSGYNPQKLEEYENFGVVSGTGASSGWNLIGEYDNFYKSNAQLSVVDPKYVENTDLHGTTSVISKYFKTKGPIGTVTAACATGQAVIQEAYRTIMLGDADVMIAASAENVVVPYGLKGFAALGASNIKDNDNPDNAARPMDESRAGLVCSDGGNAIIMEELNHALKRGARIYGEVLGYSMNCDGYHLTRPTAKGEGIYRTMKNSIEMSGIDVSQIDLIHAHSAGTKEGDLAEMVAVDRLFGNNNPLITGCKGNTGHMMCTVGTFHCIESLYTIYKSQVPPIKNLVNPILINGKMLNYVREVVNQEINYVVMNNVGFGGINSSLVVGKYR